MSCASCVCSAFQFAGGDDCNFCSRSFTFRRHFNPVPVTPAVAFPDFWFLCRAFLQAELNKSALAEASFSGRTSLVPRLSPRAFPGRLGSPRLPVLPQLPCVCRTSCECGVAMAGKGAGLVSGVLSDPICCLSCSRHREREYLRLHLVPRLFPELRGLRVIAPAACTAVPGSGRIPRGAEQLLFPAGRSRSSSPGMIQLLGPGATGGSSCPDPAPAAPRAVPRWERSVLGGYPSTGRQRPPSHRPFCYCKRCQDF